MPKKGFAYKLPTDLRDELNRLIAAGGLTIDEIWDWLKGRGVEVGRSSVHRHAQSVEAVAAEMRASREVALAVVQTLGPEAAEGQVGQLLIQVVQSIAFKIARERLVNPDGPALTMEDLMFLTSSVQKLTSAEKTDADRMEKLRAAWAKEAAARVEQTGKKMGWSADTAAAVRAEILGVSLDKVR